MRCTALVIILCLVPAVLGIDICSTRVITSSSGQITSPNYPNKYSPNTDCTLIIKQPLDTKFLFNFTYIDLGGNVYSWYCEDWITITGRSAKKFCGAKIYSSYEFNLNVVTLRFKSNGKTEHTGFKLIFTTIINKTPSGRPLPAPISVCPSRTIQADEVGRIMSPGYPTGNYGKKLDCELVLKVPFYKKVDLVVEHKDIAGGFCGNESLSFYERGYLRTTCGARVNPKQVLQGYFDRGDVSIIYRSDGTTVHSKGVMLSYLLVDKYTLHCSRGNGKLYLKRAINMSDILERQSSEMSLRFRTRRSNGLLLYINGGPNVYLLLKLQKGRIVFEFQFGTGNITLTSQLGKLYDQKWYQVVIERRGRNVDLAVSRYPPVFDPKVCRDMHWCAEYPESHCVPKSQYYDECLITCGHCSVTNIRPGAVRAQLPSNITQLLNKSQSGFNATMYVFGAPSSDAPFPVKNFKGWLQHVVINDLQPIASYVTKDTSYTVHGSKKIKTTECYND